jgi:hypothetical protein
MNTMRGTVGGRFLKMRHEDWCHPTAGHLVPVFEFQVAGFGAEGDKQALFQMPLSQTHHENDCLANIQLTLHQRLQ